MSTLEQQRVLESLFLEVARRGVRVGPRDYMDALRAMSLGFGLLSRERLTALCKTLWSRSPVEAALIDEVFGRIARPTLAEVEEVMGTRSPRGSSPRHLPEIARETEATSNQPSNMRTNARARMQIGAPEGDGLALPSAQVSSDIGMQFIMARVPLVSQRQLAVHWRRFRTPLREGLRTELDLRATIERQCRLGRLDSPVFRPQRRNQARLVVAIDVSPSMVAWNDFCADVVESLEKSRLGAYRVYFFENVALELYRSARPETPVPLERALAECETGPALLISDAGAARGGRSIERFKSTERFLAKARQVWTPIVWLNPMPRSRWRGTTAELISKDRRAITYPLSAESIARAVDVLRGHRGY